MIDESTLNILAEAGLLKRIKRSGWWNLGIPHEESVAEHSFRGAVLGYLLAKKENADPYKIMVMSLFADLPEARINDLHKVAARYLDVRDAEKKAYEEQIESLDEDIKQELKRFKKEYDDQSTIESKIARDADILECLIQAKEYSDMGFKQAEKFFKEGPKHLQTEKAKCLFEDMHKWDSSRWWEGLTKFER